jgi:hypothetical protein
MLQHNITASPLFEKSKESRKRDDKNAERFSAVFYKAKRVTNGGSSLQKRSCGRKHKTME